MTRMKEECSKLEALLDDYVDGTLDPALARNAETHLASCPECRADVESLQRLLAATAALPRELEPPHQLWPQIAGQLEPRQGNSRPNRPALQGWALQAVAALLLIAFGAFLGRLAPGVLALDPPGNVPIATVGESVAGEVLPASWEEGSVSEGFSLAEREFLRAKETLWLLALRRQDDLSPVTRKVVARNLRILDKAIEELRVALESDPGNPELETLLLDHHRRGVDLLERLARTEA